MAAIMPISWAIGTTWAVVAGWAFGGLAGALLGLRRRDSNDTSWSCLRLVACGVVAARAMARGEQRHRLDSSYTLLFLLAAIIGTSALGGLNAVITIFTPLSVIGSALILPGLPALSRARLRTERAAFGLALRLSLVSVALTGLYVGLLGVGGGSIVPRIFGELSSGSASAGRRRPASPRSLPRGWARSCAKGPSAAGGPVRLDESAAWAISLTAATRAWGDSPGDRRCLGPRLREGDKHRSEWRPSGSTACTGRNSRRGASPGCLNGVAIVIRAAERFAEKARIANSVYGPSRAVYAMARVAFWGALSAAHVRHPWVKQRPNPASRACSRPSSCSPSSGPGLESDVVEATVKNAFAQGCERVFIINNNSPDDTVEKAQLAGAELAGSYSTEKYDEHLRLRLMNEAVARISAEDGSAHIWWQFLDADEFPHGPGGLTIREYLESLDEQFRIVGSRLINHYPEGEPHYISGFHPLEFQPLCEELSGYRCSAFHLNHPLQRYDRGRPPIAASIGFHEGVSAERPLFERSEAVYFHHFPFRPEEASP